MCAETYWAFALPALRFLLAWFLLYQASPSLSGGNGLSLSVRDLLSWTGFITSSLAFDESDSNISPPSLIVTSGCGNSTTETEKVGDLRPWEAYVHGASLVLLDGMGLGSGLSATSIGRLRAACAAKLAEQVRNGVCSRLSRLLRNVCRRAADHQPC